MSTPTPTHPVVQPLPCTFCGADGDSIVVGQWLPTKWYTSCNDCASSGPPGRDRAAAVDAWNRRASPPAVQGEQPMHELWRIAIDYAIACGELSKGLPEDDPMWDDLISLGKRLDAVTVATTSSIAPGGLPLAQADVQLPGVIEQLATRWDECMYDAPGGEIDIGKAIRLEGRRFLKDSVVPPVQPSGATLSPGAASQWHPIYTAPKDEIVRLWGQSGEFHGRWGDYHRVNQPRITHWMRIVPPTSQVEQGESSSERGAAP